MFIDTTALTGNKLLATDGLIGQIQDFYFDDETWDLRYVVADTGMWLPGRLVLLAPPSFGSYHGDREEFCIHLLRQQIQNSPSSDMHKPISKYFEQEFFRYYGWPAYWNEGGAAMGVTTLFLPPREAELHAWAEQKIHQDPHLRSTAGLTDYAIQALDGEVGSVSGFLIEERDWRIHEILAECGHWYACKEVMIPTERVERISYEDCKIFVSLTKKEILDTAAHHIVKPTQPTHYQKHKFQSNILTTADTMYVASTSEWNYLL